MISGLKSIRRERAALERDRIVIGSMLEDSIIGEAFLDYDNAFFEGVTSEEIEDLIDKIPESDESDEEIERILKSGPDANVDQILGIEDELNK